MMKTDVISPANELILPNSLGRQIDMCLFTESQVEMYRQTIQKVNTD